MSFVYFVYAAVITLISAVAIISTAICVAARKLLFREVQFQFYMLMSRYVNSEMSDGFWDTQRIRLMEFLIKHNIFGVKRLYDNYVATLESGGTQAEQVSPEEEYEAKQILHAALSDPEEVYHRLDFIFRVWESTSEVTATDDLVCSSGSPTDAERIQELCELIDAFGWEGLLNMLVAVCPSSFVKEVVLKVLGESRLKDWPVKGPNPLDVLDLFQELLERLEKQDR